MIGPTGTMSAILLGVIGLPGAGDDPCRPWRDAPDRRARLRDLVDEAGDDEARRLELAARALDQALFREAQSLLEDLAADGSEQDGLRSLLGQAQQDGAWVWEEQTRHPDQAPAVAAVPEVLDARQRQKLLVDRDHAMEESSRSSWFDLVTDADERTTFHFARVLDTHFRRLKTRFRAYTGEPIHVLLFSNRSDYGHFYRQNVGAGAESVLGFYVNDNLVFFDDRFDRANVTNTALHECTHLLMDRCYQRAALPPWLHEGMACYLAAGAEDAEGQYTAGLVMEIQGRLQQGDPPRLGALLALPREGFEYPNYAAAWSWVHFLNEGSLGNRFQAFLKRLRDEVPAGGAEEETRAAVTALLYEELDQSGLLLDSAWEHYFEGEFALASERQMADFALHVLRERLPAQADEDERRRSLDLAFDALEHAGTSRDPDIAQDLAHARVLALLEGAGAADTLEALRLGIRAVRDQLRSLPEDFDAALRGQLARGALDLMRDRLLEPPLAFPLDSRAALGRIPGAGPLAEAFVVLFDDLEGMAVEALVEALAADPLHDLAMDEWVFLAMGHDPRLLEPIYLRAKLLVEWDPDDSNLALYAAVYRGMGNDRWGGFLWEEARARSVFPHLLAPWAAFLR